MQLEFLEEYFLRIYRRYGISKLKFDSEGIDVEEKFLRNMVFGSEDFNSEYETLNQQCRKLHELLKRGFCLRIRKINNFDYFVID